MTEYTKLILKKVSFDRALFSKELHKASKLLTPHEFRRIYLWLILSFGDKYYDIIREVFEQINS